MAIINTNRPGVFSKYSAYAVSASSSSAKAVGVAAKSASGVSNELCIVSDLSGVSEQFGTDTDTTYMYSICKILFAGGVSKIYAVSVDSAAPDYQSAFNLIKEQKGIGAVLCDSFDTNVLKCLDASVKSASDEGDERIAFAGGNYSDDFESAAAQINSERFCITAPCGISGGRTSGVFLAAALAAACVCTTDAGINFSGLNVSGLDGIYGSFSESRINNLISSGVTVFETINSKPEIIKAVTTKTTTEGISDSTFRSLNSIMIIDNILQAVRGNLKIMLKNLKNNQVSIGAVRSQIAVILQEKLNDGLISSFDSPSVYKSDAEPDTLIADLGFDITLNINQIHITAKVNI